MSTEQQSRTPRWGFTPAFFFAIAFSVVFPIVVGMLQKPDPDVVNWNDRLSLILYLGLISGIFYGVLWTVTEKLLLHSNYSENTSLPAGWHAVLLSLCLTLPVSVLPVVYAVSTGKNVTMSRNLILGIVLANAASGFAHVIWYGTGAKAAPFIGVRNILFPIGSPPLWRRYVAMEFSAAVMHFGSTVMVFRLAADNQSSIFGPSSVLVPTVISALFFFSGICFYSIVKFPESLSDGTWATVRGILAGMLLCIGLTGGMLV